MNTPHINNVIRTVLAAAPAPATASNGGLLLPAPAESTDIGDAVMQLLKMSSQLSDQQMQIGKSRVDAAEQQRKVAAEHRREAIDRAIEAARKAREAAEDDGGLFSCITKDLGLAGVIGLVTFQWELVGADIASHESGISDGGTNALEAAAYLEAGPLGFLAEQLATKLSPVEIQQCEVAAGVLAGPIGIALERALSKTSLGDAEKNVDRATTVREDDIQLAKKIALIVAMAAVAAGTTVLTGGTSAPAVIALVGIGISTATQICAETGALKQVFGDELAGKIAIGGMIAGTALTLGGSIGSIVGGVGGLAGASKQLQTAAALANSAKSIVEGVGGTVEGLKALDRADYQHDADLANIDATQQKHLMERLQRLVDSILDDLEEAKKSADKATEILQGTLQTRNQTMLQAASLKV
jgi:hypothetical protein